MKRIAVIGGGINGVMIAWACAIEGYQVDLYEKDTLMGATSSNSSKMLHGGIRYLEQGYFSLVREALHERAWWLTHAPHLTNRFELILPVYKEMGRSRWVIRLGTLLYELLAHGSGFPTGRWYDTKEVLAELPNLKCEGLVGAFSYWDGQMDDYQLGLWAAKQAKSAGVRLHEGMRVSHILPRDGILNVAGETKKFDLIINATGPWVKQLLKKSEVESRYDLDLVQGMHILVDRDVRKGCVIQCKYSKRIVFVLPYQGKALIGTTERKIKNPDDCDISELEIDYLINSYNEYFANILRRTDVVDTFCGTRPIVSSKKNFSTSSRESVLEKNGKLISVFGGKWTTSRSLAYKVLVLVNKII